MTTWAIPPANQDPRNFARTVLPVLLTFIAAVSLYDTWLTYRLRDVILGTEENPICKWLILQEPDHLGLFVPCKLFGTVFVVVFCLEMHRRFQRLAMPVTGGVALFQSWLLCYLQT